MLAIIIFPYFIVGHCNNCRRYNEFCCIKGELYYIDLNVPLKCFGQQTNSTPENTDIPHGNNIAKLRICMPRSWQAAAPVWFHLMNGQQRDALWIWSKRQPSGTKRASDWNGPSVEWQRITIISNLNANYFH